MSSTNKKEINHPLIEDKRPPMYAAMKYWGKKPHNIWRTYIEAYAPEGGTVLDPFAGSATSAFEAVKAGRKAVAFDLNPLTSFLIEVYCTKFEQEKYKLSVLDIVSKIQNDGIYRNCFTTRCENCNDPCANIIQNCKWKDGEMYEVGVSHMCSNNADCPQTKRSLRKPDRADIDKAKLIAYKDFFSGHLKDCWIPGREFPESVSFTASFIEKIGGKYFYLLWTPRNLYVFSRIFELILSQKNESIKKHLLFGFIQSLHLSSRMCVPRRKKANRPFSTSWGRSAFICSARSMEMNPLLVFENSCIGKKQSVLSSVSKVESYLGKIPKILRVEEHNKSSVSGNYDIKYGIVDTVTLDNRYVTKKDKVEFIITDPPYGGLVQYMDLSTVWLAWLEKYEDRFAPDYERELTINHHITLDSYQSRMTCCFGNLAALLPDDGKIVFTFHNKKISIWNAFIHALLNSGLKVEKVIHQPNRRTGESNVANPYGTSANDFYIRCSKTSSKPQQRMQPIETAIVNSAIKTIAKRNEPTPFQVLLNMFLAEIINGRYVVANFNKQIKKILNERMEDVFEIVKNNEVKNGGSLWWLKNPGKHIKNPDLPLSERVRYSVLTLLRTKCAVTLDEALAEIYVNYPNGLTPDKRSVQSYLDEFATRSHGKWSYKGDRRSGVSEHTEMLVLLAKAGRKMGYGILVGDRERSEVCSDGGKLSEHEDSIDLRHILHSEAAIRRIKQIDMLWVGEGSVEYAIEVENTTTFVHGIQRASNLGSKTPKIMVIPDKRLSKLKRVLSDDLTSKNFKGQNWCFLKYSDLRTLSQQRSISAVSLARFLQTID